VIVVDNASMDGSAAMVCDEFPQVRLIARRTNIGAPAWNDGFAAARGDYVLILDDDCYLPADGLTRAIDAALTHEAELVSFKVISTYNRDWVFTEKYRTGLLSFWGCAWLVRREVLEEIGGYDPDLFMWANELEFCLRFYDRGYRHLHFPAVVAEHMKRVSEDDFEPVDWRGYRVNYRHWSYIAAKRLHAEDAAGAFASLLLWNVRDGIREGPSALTAVPGTLRGFLRGLLRREPIRSAELSHFYRHNFECFVSPWVLARPPRELIRALPGEIARWQFGSRRRPRHIGREAEFYGERARVYPSEPAALKF